MKRRRGRPKGTVKVQTLINEQKQLWIQIQKMSKRIDKYKDQIQKLQSDIEDFDETTQAA